MLLLPCFPPPGGSLSSLRVEVGGDVLVVGQWETKIGIELAFISSSSAFKACGSCRPWRCL